jgi:ATP synthase subunit 6
MILNPLEQFNIFSLFIFFENISIESYTALAFTNTNFFVLLNMVIFLFFFKLLNLKNSTTIIPNRFQYLLESIYNFILEMLVENLGTKAKDYFSWVFFVFIFLLIMNVSGMVPYSFTLTSHLIITFWLGLGLFIGINIVAISTHGVNFLSLFLPSGVSLALAPLLIGIELISYFIRVVSLSVRLFANMMSGHILLKVLLGFSWTMMISGTPLLYLLHFIPLLVVFLLIGLELAVAFIQAYVFTMLLCIYLNDAINLHYIIYFQFMN